MFYRSIIVILVVVLFGGAAFAQGTIDQYGNFHPSEDALAKNKRIADLLKQGSVISLRLVSQKRDGVKEEPSNTPSPYTVKERVHFELFLTQHALEDIVLQTSAWPYWEYRPDLKRDGDVIPYTKRAEGEVDKSEKASGSMGLSTFIPGREVFSDYVNLEDWYETPLKPGHYQLVVRKRFVRNGEWAESNPVTFDVVEPKIETKPSQ